MTFWPLSDSFFSGFLYYYRCNKIAFKPHPEKPMEKGRRFKAVFKRSEQR